MANTVPPASSQLVALLEALRDDLRKANAAIDVIGNAAIAKAEELAKAIEQTKEVLAAALAHEADLARKERLAVFSDISIVAHYPDSDETNPLRATFKIAYIRDSYDMQYRRAVPKRFEISGFQALPDEAYEYLVECKPEAIPAVIMDLAPGDPRAALARYFTGLRRGYLPAITPKAAA